MLNTKQVLRKLHVAETALMEAWDLAKGSSTSLEIGGIHDAVEGLIGVLRAELARNPVIAHDEADMIRLAEPVQEP